MNLKVPSCWREEAKRDSPRNDNDEEVSDSSEDAPLHVEALRRRRPRHNQVSRIRKGFTFCMRNALPNPDDLGRAEILHAQVTENTSNASLVMHQCYVELDEEPGVWKLDATETCAASVGEMLPPFEWKMEVCDARAKTHGISDALQEKFSDTVANLSIDVG